MCKLTEIQHRLKAPKGQYNSFGKTYNQGKHVPLETEAYIKSHFSYNPQTGLIIRNDRINSNGSLDKDGYLIIKIKGRQYKAHRLAWFLFYGEFPNMEIDHINRDRKDNRITNLRVSSRLENVLNIKQSPNKNTGVIGIYIDKYTKGLKKKFSTRFVNAFRQNFTKQAL